MPLHLLCLLTFGLGCPAGPAPMGAELQIEERPFAALEALEDQNGRAYRAGKSAAPLIVVVGDRSVSEQTQAWADALEKELGPRVLIVRVLDVADLTPMAAPLVKRGIRKQVGQRDVRVYLDWKGRVAKRYEATAGRPTVLCLDRRGGLRLKIAQKLTEESLQKIARLHPKPPRPLEPILP